MTNFAGFISTLSASKFRLPPLTHSVRVRTESANCIRVFVKVGELSETEFPLLTSYHFYTAEWILVSLKAWYRFQRSTKVGFGWAWSKIERSVVRSSGLTDDFLICCASLQKLESSIIITQKVKRVEWTIIEHRIFLHIRKWILARALLLSYWRRTFLGPLSVCVDKMPHRPCCRLIFWLPFWPSCYLGV